MALDSQGAGIERVAESSPRVGMKPKEEGVEKVKPASAEKGGKDGEEGDAEPLPERVSYLSLSLTCSVH